MPPPPYLQEHVKEIRVLDVKGHAVEYPFENWADTLKNFPCWNTFTELFNHQQVSRSELFLFPISCNLDAQVFFTATMAWGYGYAGYGPWRTAQGLSQNNLGDHILTVIKQISDDNLALAYDLVNIQYCGPAFFTKLFYFAGRQRIRKYPLILDSVIANKLENSLGLDSREYSRFTRNVQGIISSVQRNRVGYLRYIDHMHTWAAELQCEADQIELFLFNN